MYKTTTLIVLCLLFLMASTPPSNTYEIGDVIKDFTLENVDGKKISLSSYDNKKGVILIFDCNTCPYSQAYLNRIKQLHSKYESKGYPVMAINPNDPNRSPGDSMKKMISYAKKNDYQHAYLQDVDQSVAKAFGATNTPQVFVLQKQGANMVLQYIGAIDNNTQDADAATKKYVEDVVNSLLNDQKPEATKTKAIGCTIKWKSA